MTKTATFFGTVGMMTVTALTLYGSTGCSSDGTATDAGTGTTVSAAYKSNCQRCHGPEGEGGGQYPKIPGSNSSSEAAFIATVRSGRPGTAMTSFSASQISDDDLKADYKFLSSR